MTSLSDFQVTTGNAISYKDVEAGDFVAGFVTGGLLAAGRPEYAEILRSGRHVVETGYFDEEQRQFETFVWYIYANPSAYATVATASAKEAFLAAIKQLQLPVLRDVTDVFVVPEVTVNPDWREQTAAEIAKARKTVSTDTLQAFADVIAYGASVRIIRTAFEGAGFAEGISSFAGGDRRKILWDFLANVDQTRDGEAGRLAGVLWSMLETMHDQGRPKEELRKIADRLERESFPDERRSALFGAQVAVPEPKAAAVEAASTSLVGDVIAFLRAVPRGVNELAAEHRYGGRSYGYVEIKDEYDLQDFVRAFLRMRFPTAQFEDPVGKVAGIGGRVDFSLRGDKIFVELKMIKSADQWPKMHADISSKFERYSNDGGCDHLIVFVYDPNMVLREAPSIEAEMTAYRDVTSESKAVKRVVYESHVIVGPQR